MKPIEQIKKDIRFIVQAFHGGNQGDDGCAGDIKYGMPWFHFQFSWSDGWEHLSVSTSKRCPTWDEMCFFKDLFWWDHETVMQLHPPRQEYVNCHPYCLHLWRPVNVEIPLPSSWMVGPKS